MVNIVEHLEAKKDVVMSFRDGKQISFADALKKLGEVIGQPQASTAEIIQTIKTAAANRAVELMEEEKNPEIKKTPNAQTQRVLAGLFTWVRSIHNDQIFDPTNPNNRFPNNIVYEMLEAQRGAVATGSASMENNALLFFLDGANARKLCYQFANDEDKKSKSVTIGSINTGITPGPDWVATSELVATILSTGIETENSKELSRYYDSNFINAQRFLTYDLTMWGKTPLPSSLFSKGVFRFDKVKNEQTGANRYILDERDADGKYLSTAAVGKGLEAFKGYVTEAKGKGTTDAEIEAEVASTVTKTSKLCTKFSTVFGEAEAKARKELAAKGTNPELIEKIVACAKWDASEWLSRAYVALRVAAEQETYPSVAAGARPALAEFDKNPALKDIIDRSRTGEFPANERNASEKSVGSLDEMKLADGLYFQAPFVDSIAVKTIAKGFELIPAAERALAV
jgi:hypothetical protein